MKMLSKVLIFISLISVTTYAILNGPVKDCTVSHKAWEISSEDFEAYCQPTYCQCFSEKGCPPEWSTDIVEGLAMMWMFTNQNLKTEIKCVFEVKDQDYNKTIAFTISTETDRQFLQIRAKPTDYVIYNIYDNMWSNRWNVFDAIGVKTKINTKTLFDFAVRPFKNPSYVSLDVSLDAKNFYPTTLMVNFAEDVEPPAKDGSQTKHLDSVVIGPFGGKDIPHTSAYFRFQKYFDQSLGLDSLKLRFTTETIQMDDSYHSIISRNKGFSGTLGTTQFMCFGRKINPKTNRTHWTGEGCRPVVYYKTSGWEQFLGNYEISCKCDFESLGLNAPDDDPNAKQVEGFGTDSKPDPDSKDLKQTIEPSNATKTSTYWSIALFVIALLILLIGCGLLVYVLFIL